MSRHFQKVNLDVALLKLRCRDINMSMSRHWENFWRQCHNIVVDVATLERGFVLSENFYLFTPILFLKIQFMLMNISLSILRNLNSRTNSNT